MRKLQVLTEAAEKVGVLESVKNFFGENMVATMAVVTAIAVTALVVYVRSNKPKRRKK